MHITDLPGGSGTETYCASVPKISKAGTDKPLKETSWFAFGGTQSSNPGSIANSYLHY